MDKTFVMEIANTIRQQIIAGVGANVFFSWGVSKMIATEFKGMASLILKVNGRVHKGDVIVAYNEGIDYYEIYLGKKNEEPKQIATDVDFTQLGDIIDRHIEAGDNYDEYVEFVKGERAKLMSGQI